MNKYLVARKKGEMANEVFHLKKDALIKAAKKSTIPFFIRWIKRIKTKEDVIKYHIKKIDKILNSKNFIIEETTKDSIDDLIEVSTEIYNNKYEFYTENDIITEAEIVYKKISSPIWFSLFSMKLNLFEWMLLILLFYILSFVF